MKTILNPILIIVLLLSISSCEKKITLYPENSEQKITVEAIFANHYEVSTVRITKSKSIYEPITNHEQITDADVKVIDLTTGDQIDFVYNTSDDVYRTTTSGIPGHEYKLEINAEDKHITARKTMTSPIALQRVISVPTENNPDKYYLQIEFDDPPQQENYYLFIMQPADPNSGLESRFTVLSDHTYDRVNGTINIPDEIFNKDEQWLVLFFHIDRENFNYLKVILRAMKSLVNGAHPFYGLSLGNPTSTVEGEHTLGYFIASPVTYSPIVIGN